MLVSYAIPIGCVWHNYMMSKSTSISQIICKNQGAVLGSMAYSFCTLRVCRTGVWRNTWIHLRARHIVSYPNGDIFWGEVAFIGTFALFYFYMHSYNYNHLVC